MSKPLRISIAGTGKVAQALGRAWQNGGVEIIEVWGRSQDRAQELGRKLNAVVVYDLGTLSTDIDAVAVLVSDDAISQVAQSLPNNVKRFHASGVTDRDV
ncbi:MAG: NAD(P)-binding domain-containing protein, partial [Bacteroidetes bacterium]|nr:NAD(P)-binding domain-containing protein [Bacteroidota bacterium]